MVSGVIASYRYFGHKEAGDNVCSGSILATGMFDVLSKVSSLHNKDHKEWHDLKIYDSSGMPIFIHNVSLPSSSQSAAYTPLSVPPPVNLRSVQTVGTTVTNDIYKNKVLGEIEFGVKVREA